MKNSSIQMLLFLHGVRVSFVLMCELSSLEPDRSAFFYDTGGDFYETYGVDAIMLVEHCGLNAMAGKAKAGCPIRNVQATLDCTYVIHMQICRLP